MAGIELINVHKQYRVEDRTVPVLRGIGLQIPERQITVILGRSGCGKTTLLRLTGDVYKRQPPLPGTAGSLCKAGSGL